MKRTKIAFCVAGLGLGNATRVSAIIESILASGRNEISIAIFTWGKSYDFFSRKKLGKGIELVRLHSYLEKENQANIYERKFLLSLPRVFSTYWRNSWLIHQRIRRERPDVAVLDSDFSFLPFLLRGVPVVAISQAAFVSRRWLRYRPRRRRFGYWLRFLAFELGDLALNGVFARRIVVPSLSPFRPRWRKIKPIGLIVRESFRAWPEEAGTKPETRLKVGVIRSGSGVAREEVDQLISSRRWTDLNAAARPPGETGYRPVLHDAQVVATQCGLSSLSECIACRKPMVLLPIDMHPEQLVNCRELIRLGLAITVEDLEKGVPLPHPEAEREWPACNGAKQAADLVLAEGRG